MPGRVVLLIILCAVLTMGANLGMRHGLLQVGGFVLKEDGIPGLLFRLARSWSFVLGVLAYALAAVVWFKVLSLAEVSSSYPLLVGLTFVLVTTGAVLLFHEELRMLKVAGIVVILVGIVLISKS